MRELLNRKKIIFGSDEKTQPTRKYLLKENLDENISSLLYFGGSDDALLSELEIDFENPKVVEVSKKLIYPIAKQNDIVIDFFAGSGTVAHSIMSLNKDDGGNRKFICVQLPEPTDEKREANKAGYKTVSDITKERIRRVITKIKTEQAEAQANIDFLDQTKTNTVLDLGFRVFKLQKSNFKVWDANTKKEAEAIQQALELHVDHIDPQAEQEAILFELLLKSGFELTTPIENLTLAGKTVFSIAEGALLICLDKTLTSEVIKAMAEINPSRVICLDEGFQDNDQLKTNAVLIMKSQGVNDFRTV
jgi:adenine-specific DNA-methyltransferase